MLSLLRFSWGTIWFERFDLCKKLDISQLCWSLDLRGTFSVDSSQDFGCQIYQIPAEKYFLFKMLITFDPKVAERSVASQNDHKSKACHPEASNAAFTMYRRLKRRLRRL